MKKLIATAAILVALASSAFAGEAGTTGKINSIDTANRTINFTHGPIEALGWPGMTMDFVVDPAVDPASLPVGEEVMLQLHRNPDFSMTLVGIATAAAVSQ